MPGIFISYRRGDSGPYAGRLYDRLVAHFGANIRIFRDVDDIDPGEDFIEKIEATVASCDVLVVVIGRHWLKQQDEAGRRRLDDPADLVRREVAMALDRKVRIIPTLVGGARMPRSQHLPEGLGALTRRNALEFSDKDFASSAKHLIRAIETAISEAETHRRSLVEELSSTRKEGRGLSSNIATVKTYEEAPLTGSEGDDVRIQSGTVTVNATLEGWNLLVGDGEREFTKEISFDEPPFLVPPTVVVALMHLDVATEVFTRIRVTARNVKSNGFLLVLKTWSDSQVYGVGASWLAYGP